MTNYRASCSDPSSTTRPIGVIFALWILCDPPWPVVSFICLLSPASLTNWPPAPPSSTLAPQRAWSLVRSTLLFHQTTYLLPSLSSSESGIDLETGQCCKGVNRKWGGSSETCDRNYNLRLLFYGTMQNKNEMFWSDPIIHDFKMYLFFAENTFHLFHFYFASYPISFKQFFESCQSSNAFVLYVSC